MNGQVRFLQSKEAQLFRRLRMAALVESPLAFGERVEDAARRSDADWDTLAERLAAQTTMAMVVAEREGEPIGMTFVFNDDAHDDGVRIGGMWVAPTCRRQRFGKDLVRLACDWARALGRFTLRLWVGADMTETMAFYRRCGFEATGVSKPFPGQEPRVIVELLCKLNGDVGVSST